MMASLNLSEQALAAQSMYNNRAAKYDDSFHPTHAQDFAAFTHIQDPSLHILDLACGTGLVTIPMTQALVRSAASSSSITNKVTGSVTGVDASEDMMAIAQENIEKHGLKDHITLHQGDIAALHTLPAGTLRAQGYDIITCASALPLFMDPGALIKHWASFLAPGGILVVDIPTERSQLVGLVFEATIRECGEGDRLVWTREWVKDQSSLEGLFKAAGLKIADSGIIKWHGGGHTYSEEEGKKEFDHLMGAAMTASLRELGERFWERARDVFVEKWKARGEGERLSEEDGFYVVVGRGGKET